MDKPWEDWIPGVLSNAQLRDLCEQGHIANVEEYDKDDGPLDYSSLDLTLGDEGYWMREGSVKPFGARYEHEIKTQGLATKLSPDGDGVFLLKSTRTYLFRLRERIMFKENARLYGQATAKSTIGRTDVLARLIVDGADHYEGFDPEALHKGGGDMYIEITPMTFNVRVRPGISLSQLRLFRGRPEDSEIRGQEVYEPLLHGEPGQEMDGSLSVDLQAVSISGNDVCAFWANRMKDEDEPIDLWLRESLSPCKHWRFLSSDDHGRIKIEKNHFYILRSSEKISLTEGVAVYCKASDERIGEMRIHYAGFVHPFFGTDREDRAPGTSLIFEVRGHDVDVSLRNGEKMAQLIFYRMSAPATRRKKPSSEGDVSAKKETRYNEQGLELSKIFAPWPEKIEVGKDGTVKDLTE